MPRNPFYNLPTGAMVTGPAEDLIEAFFGPRQHDSHLQLWRWHQYTKDYDTEATLEALRQALREPVTLRCVT